MKKNLSLILTFCLILTSLAGCSGAKTGRGGDFVYYLKNSIRSLDPQTATDNGALTVINAMFEGLCRVNSEGTAEAGIAESWSSNADFTTFTFTLKKNAVWSNGKKITANDFVYGIRRALSPATGAENVDELFVIKNAKDAYYGLADVSSVGVSAQDDHTVVFSLNSSCPEFPVLTARARFMPCNEEFFLSTTGRYGLGVEYLLTDGPFTFQNYYSWMDGEYIKLEPYDEYTGRAVQPKTLSFYLGEIDEMKADPVYALTNGITDVLALENQQQADSATGAGCRVYSFGNRVTGLLLNTDYYELTTRVREIMVKSINRESIESALSASVSIANDIVPPGLEYNGTDYRSYAESSLFVKQDSTALDFENYDTKEESEFVIIDATSENGEEGEETRIYTEEKKDDEYLIESEDEELEYMPSITVICPDDFMSINIANAVISSWNEFSGSYFNINPLSEREFLEAIEEKDYQAAIYTLESGSDTALSLLSRFGSDAWPQILNSPAYDTLLHAGSDGIAGVTGLEKFLNNQYIFYPIYYSSSYYATSPKAQDVNVEIGRIDFIDAHK
ncbi:MAG: ABC transporter substrate-binding protein [Clostridia bacterium]|nr:ABC transporter substrate-binding protein [Clostridia bacterium]